MKLKFCLFLAALACTAGTNSWAITTVDGVYQIGTAQDLVDFAALVNDSQADGTFSSTGANAVLTADIDMTGVDWTPICCYMVKNTDYAHYYGTFDGQGHKISNLSCTRDANGSFGSEVGELGTCGGAALFGAVGKGATLKNLTIDATCSFENTAGRAAAFIAYCGHKGDPEAEYVTLKNLTNKASVTGTAQVAGFISRPVSETSIDNGLFTLVMTDCVNEGNITSTGSCGGLIGDGLAPTEMTNCANKGIVSGAANTGGIFGIQNGVTTLNNTNNLSNVNGGQPTGGFIGLNYAAITFNECTNEGDVTSTAAWAGGFIGNASSGEYTITISDCENSGTIKGGTTSVGGFVGRGNGKNAYVITDCNNTGNISGTGCVSGFLGNTTSGGTYTATLTNCHNSGDITATGTASGTGQAGGLIGDATFKATITNCSNTGKITGGYNYIGGLVGNINSGDILLTRCFNAGTVINTSAYTGGVIGYTGADLVNATLTDCYNTGVVTSGGQTVGGLIGSFYKKQNGTLTFNHCYNVGDVTCKVANNNCNAGGLLGWLRGEAGNKVVARNCWNVAAITGTDVTKAAQIGGLIGVAGANTTAEIYGCYNTGAVSGTASVRGLAGHFSKPSNCIVQDSWNSGVVSGLSDGNTLVVTGMKSVTNSYDLANDEYSPVYGTPAGYSDTWLSNGAFTYLINNNAGARVFNQTVGIDAHPVLDQTHGIVNKISSAGYATQFIDDTDVIIPTGVKAYAGKVNGEWLTLNEISEMIPAGTAVVLTGDEGFYSFVPTTGAEAVNDNDLKGTAAALNDLSGYSYYVLLQPTDSPIGFYQISDIIPAGKAYLQLSLGAGVKGFTFASADGIVSPIERKDESTVIFDLTGRRVENAVKGIFIINGKKVLK